MKKTVMMLAAILFSAALFTSCNDGKKGTTPENIPDTTPAFAQVTITFEATQDMLNYADMVASYNDGTGDKSETITGLTWEKTLKVALPGAITVGRTITMKEAVTFTEDQHFAYIGGYNASVEILNAASEKVKKGNTHSVTVNNNLKADKVVKLINDGELNSTLTLTFDKDGREVN